MKAVLLLLTFIILTSGVPVGRVKAHHFTEVVKPGEGKDFDVCENMNFFCLPKLHKW